ncbi:HWE histidine kinase domain-containing protein [Oricola cellulosilytica]|uniref:Blue-light-activated histidine kinase n=1 Tax=Oricola cellulosilytica TaxID=1429082 RepID=A0A4R0PCV5_9HYPH|nr:HWE histidine kinase domain-containing protein [Oricola cellulosilytica]TCD14248.1 GAF domain-containing protein [Oricola cellulosilytica]
MTELPSRDRVDLTNCDREPIHALGRVQSFGFLIGVTSDWIVSHASTNISEFINADARELIGMPAREMFPDDTIHAIRNKLQNLGSRSGQELIGGVSFRGNDRLFDLSIHVSGETIVVESEPHDGALAVIDEITGVQVAAERLNRADTPEKMLDFAVRFVRALTGFDRVMGYRFLPDDSGEVVAEAKSAGMEPFLGLRYPASDIPKQARALYVKNPIRIIADSHDDGFAIEPAPASVADTIDLSGSVLRSVSPIHIEYLRNMGVRASMSVSIIVEGKLWGLIACHHDTPRALTQAKRNAALLFGQMLSLILQAKLSNLSHSLDNRVRDITNAISRSASADVKIKDLMLAQAEAIIDMMEADGMAIVRDGAADIEGMTASPDELGLIARALNARPAGMIVATNQLSTIVPEAADYAERVAGLLAIPISKTPRDYLMLCRREVSKSVKWAGNPAKPVTVGPNGARLTPRKSFETWAAIVNGQSEDWTPAQIRAADQLRITLLEVVLRLTDEASSERKRANEKQELLIAELNHRVRNLLGLVRSLISQTNGGGMSTEEFVRVLDSRVQALARAHDQITKDNWSPASLKGLIRTEAESYLVGKQDRVRIDGEDVFLVPVAFSNVALVVHELITNSAKYGALSDNRGQVKVSLRRGNDGSLFIDWVEKGGPPVKAPTRRGFGTTIIEHSIPFELRGTASIDYRLSGVRAEFCIPASHVRDAPSEVPASVVLSTEKIAEVPFPAEVMVVEDNLLIAMDAEDALKRLGAQNVTVCPGVDRALEHLEKNPCNFALLDINLGSETSTPVAEELLSRGTPFVFASGYGEKSALPDGLDTVPILSKPYDGDGIRAAYAAVMPRAVVP